MMLLGGLLASAGMISASFTTNIIQLYMTAGVLTGVDASLIKSNTFVSLLLTWPVFLVEFPLICYFPFLPHTLMVCYFRTSKKKNSDSRTNLCNSQIL